MAPAIAMSGEQLLTGAALRNLTGLFVSGDLEDFIESTKS
jgi:hypothetical protein